MSLMRVKAGALVSAQVIIALAVSNAATVLGLPDMLITSGRDGAHMAGSLHYRDRALDFRTKHLTSTQKAALVAAVRTRLKAGYDVVLESVGRVNEHLHVEHDPR